MHDMKQTYRQYRGVPRRFLPLFALTLALAAPVIVEARAGGGYPSGRGNAVSHPINPAGGVQSGSRVRPLNGELLPVMPTPAATAIPMVQQIRNNALAPAGIGSPVASTANPDTSTAEPTRTTPRRSTSSDRTPPFIVSAVVLILAAGSAATIVGFFAFCRYVRRRERQQLRGVR
jgi:hypothetical protein